MSIEKCREKYRELFLPQNNVAGLEENNDNDSDRVTKESDFQLFFFKEMNNALFSAEYLRDDFLDKIREFENEIANDRTRFSAAISCTLQRLRDVLLEIINKIEGKQIYTYSYFEFIKPRYVDDFQYFSIWLDIVLRLTYIDHTLISNTKYRDELLLLITRLEEARLGIDNKDFDNIYQRLLIKAAFLLQKLELFNKQEIRFISVKSEIREIKDICDSCCALKEYYSLFKDMYQNRIPERTIKEHEASINSVGSLYSYVVLAYNYATTSKERREIEYNFEKIKALKERFIKFKERSEASLSSCKFDRYAIRTVQSFIHNCYFSLFTKSKECTIASLQDELENIKEVEARTGIRNYHPYKKALDFLKSLSQEVERNVNWNFEEITELYNQVYKKYVENYKASIREHLYPFQLTIEECKVQSEFGEIFVASSFARPISPRKLKDSEQDFREVALSSRVNMHALERERELQTLVKNTREELTGYRKEIFEYIGVFIAIATILFGGVQHFLQAKSAQASIRNFLSIGILLALFMLVLYFVVYKKEKSFWYLIAFIGLCIVLLFLLPIFQL